MPSDKINITIQCLKIANIKLCMVHNNPTTLLMDSVLVVSNTLILLGHEQRKII